VGGDWRYGGAAVEIGGYGGAAVEISAPVVLRWRSVTVREFVFRCETVHNMLCENVIFFFVFLTKKILT
jgi:hypothetical protein